MTIYFTSDLHFGHRKITEYTERGRFTNSEKHTRWLMELWNDTVTNEDTVYHLGDFTFDNRFLAREFAKLKGEHIIMLKGNHDSAKVWRRFAETEPRIQMHDYLEVNIEGQHICLFHFPISSWHRQHHGAWHLHGHCHSNLKIKQGRMLDVGLDSAYDVLGEHKFFTFEDVKKYMETIPLQVSDHHTVREGSND
jgi:calcineurin-like phosphoesterase family protein